METKRAKKVLKWLIHRKKEKLDSGGWAIVPFSSIRYIMQEYKESLKK